MLAAVICEGAGQSRTREMVEADDELDKRGKDGRVPRLQKLRENVIGAAAELRDECEKQYVVYECPACALDEKQGRRRR